MTKRIITISREFGSGGRFIGEEVAKKLGIAYYDKNIINEIAEKSGLSPEYVFEIFSQKISTHILTVLIIGVILQLEQRRGTKRRKKFLIRKVLAHNTSDFSDSA